LGGSATATTHNYISSESGIFLKIYLGRSTPIQLSRGFLGGEVLRIMQGGLRIMQWLKLAHCNTNACGKLIAYYAIAIAP